MYMGISNGYNTTGEEGDTLNGDTKPVFQLSLSEDFWKFVKGFKNGEGDRVYELRLNQIGYSSPEPLVIDFYDLYDYDEDLARHLIEHPVKSIEQFESVAHKNKVRIRHLAETTPIREIDTAKIARLIMVQGIVVKAGQETSKIHKAVYECSLCGELYEMDQKYQYLARPEDRCGCKGTAKKWVFALDQSSFIDNQRVWIQESPEQLPPGQIPERLEVDLNSELVGTVKPGDRVHITGYAHLKMKNPISTKLELSRFMIANYVETTNKYMDLVELTEGEIEQIKELAKDPYIMRRIVRSIAPSIYGHVTIKKAIALQQFGSDAVVKPDIRKRGDIHILLIGDPGGGKSALLIYATILSNRGIYSVGRGSTAAGLTATVLKEKGGEGYTLEVGTLVIADTGHASLDELEKMRDEDREAIHPAMEQQIIPINKGGINLILNARCSILAAANPKLGRYNPHATIAENINNLPITILNRFDLIFIMRDTPDEEKDAATSEIILDLMVDEPNLLTLKQLKQYIAYSKQIKPKLTEKVARHISDFYVKLRQQSKGDIEAAIMITPRQLESIIRLTKAHARAHLREEVIQEDADAAIDLFRESMKQVGIDPATGKYDIDLLESGIPRSLQKKLWTLIDIVGKFQKSSTDNTVSEEVLFEYLRDNWKMTDLKIKELVRTAERDGVIFSPLPGFYKKV